MVIIEVAVIAHFHAKTLLLGPSPFKCTAAKVTRTTKVMDREDFPDLACVHASRSLFLRFTKPVTTKLIC